MNILEALQSLDPLDDDQWTADGSPKVDVVNALVEGETVDRKAIQTAAPQFTRQNPTVELPVPNSPSGEDETSGDDAADETVDQDVVNSDESPEGETDVPAEEGPNEAEIALQAYLDGDVMGHQSFLAWLKQQDSGILIPLEEIVAGQLEEAHAAIRRAENVAGHLKLSLGYVRTAVKANIPDMSNQKAIQTYIAAQAENRGVKKETAKQMLAGVDISKLDYRSPVDRAMARKTGRGTARPKIL